MHSSVCRWSDGISESPDRFVRQPRRLVLVDLPDYAPLLLIAQERAEVMQAGNIGYMGFYQDIPDAVHTIRKSLSSILLVCLCF